MYFKTQYVIKTNREACREFQIQTVSFENLTTEINDQSFHSRHKVIVILLLA